MRLHLALLALDSFDLTPEVHLRANRVLEYESGDEQSKGKTPDKMAFDDFLKIHSRYLLFYRFITCISGFFHFAGSIGGFFRLVQRFFRKQSDDVLG